MLSTDILYPCIFKSKQCLNIQIEQILIYWYIKLRYYKEVINPTLEDQKYLSVLISTKKKINIENELAWAP